MICLIAYCSGCYPSATKQLTSLTPQPILPKLHPTHYMASRRLRLFALLLGSVFLAAQLHFCADLSAGPIGSHGCPFCTGAASAIVTPLPSITLVPVLNRFESLAVLFNIPSPAPRATSPRAPPFA